jgi:hypothetical protein
MAEYPLIDCVDDGKKDELRKLYLALGGDPVKWDAKHSDKEMESTEEIGRIMAEAPHYRGKPG